MIDQSRVTSGFDTEVLLGARYVRYLLLSSVETGTLPMRIELDDPVLSITLHPPVDYDRRYEPHPDAEPLPEPMADAFDTAILFDQQDGADIALRMRADILDPDSGQSVEAQFIDLFASLSLETETDDDGALSDARLRFEVVQLALDPVLEFLLLLEGVSTADLLPLVKAEVDRELDFGLVGAGQSVQAIALHKHEAGGAHAAALGVYLNLRLRSGPAPDEFLADRGDLDASRNFLPDGEDIAFGMPGSLYARLGDDARFRMAEEVAPGSGSFHFPIRENMSDPESEQLGRIKDITVEPLGDDRLRIDVHGEFFVDNFPDPDFHFKFDLTPRIENGLLDFDVDHDLDVDLLGEFLIALVIGALIFGIGVSFLVGLLVFGVQELIVEPIAQTRVSEQAEGQFDASFLDALPHRIGAERRRWDPFYVTEHQIVALLERLQITDQGIGFSGLAALDREADAVSHVVIRDETRSPEGMILDYKYRVVDHASFSEDLAQVFPGTDRRPSEHVVDDVETNLFRLTPDQLRSRIAEDRLRENIVYLPKKAHVQENQIRRLLCISETEVAEERSRIIRAFRAETREQLLAEQGDDLREEVTEELEQELGEPPTDEQVDEALEARLDELVAEEEDNFVEDELPGRLDAGVEALLRFDLDSPELLALEDDRAVFLRGDLQRILMRRAGRESRYYRDRPDASQADNLLSLPRYTPSGA